MADRRPALSEGGAAEGRAPGVRARIAGLEASGIRAIADSAMGRKDVIPLWFGEPDLPTPRFICDAAAGALRAGHTFYAPNRGLAELVAAIAGYETRVHGREVGEDRVVVTCAGMNALMMVAELLVDPDDEVLCVTPVWPNFLRCVEIMGGRVPQVPIEPRDGRWRLDLDRLFDAVGPATRAIYLSSPNNPTGWMAERDDLQAILDFCRREGIWVVADEVYARIVYDRDAAPSFLDIAEPEDAVIVVNSFSKSWAMTGWRLGWAVAPPAAAALLENLNEFNVAAPPTPAQHAGVVAVRDGEGFVREMRERYAAARDIVVEELGRMERVRLIRPEAAFYAFFGVEGMESPSATAREILMRTSVGLAPGDAFGAGGDGHLRLCYAKTPDLLREALARLAPVLG